MKPILFLILIAFAGCSTPKSERLFIENLSRQLSENNASWTAIIPTARGVVNLSRANPTIGMSGSAGTSGASVTSLTNLQMSLQYHVATPQPTMPGVNTTNNPTQKVKP